LTPMMRRGSKGFEVFSKISRIAGRSIHESKRAEFCFSAYVSGNPCRRNSAQAKCPRWVEFHAANAAMALFHAFCCFFRYFSPFTTSIRLFYFIWLMIVVRNTLYRWNIWSNYKKSAPTAMTNDSVEFTFGLEKKQMHLFDQFSLMIHVLFTIKKPMKHKKNQPDKSQWCNGSDEMSRTGK
jgi:hypothetical protein